MTLTPEGYTPRLIDARINMMLETFGAVCVEGPKWCGKTWSALSHAESAIFIGDPKNNFHNRMLVNTSLDYALNGDRPRLIDEWQDIPAIWDGVRFEADKTSDKGKYILTGSSTPNYKGIFHSGAGRIGRARMRTLSLFESGDSSGAASLMSLFNSSFVNTDPVDTSLEHLIDLTVRGGWPGIKGLSTPKAMELSKEYLETITRLDVSAVDGVRRDSYKMMMLIRSLARNESTTAGNTTLMKGMAEYDGESISEVTIADYLESLRSIFLLEEQSAFNPNMRSSVRVGKSPKRHLTDPSLSIAALKMSPEMLLDDLRTYGFMFEAMCERDLHIYAQSLGGSLFHYRDAKGREIDAVLELPDGRRAAFEIKLGTDRIDEAARNLLKFKETVESSPEARPLSALCVISGMAPCAYLRRDGVYVAPITALRN